MTTQNTKYINEDLTKELIDQYGLIIGNADLRHVLGYKSFTSFNRAVRMNLINVNIFEIENRRGKFALTKEVAYWLSHLGGKEKEGFKKVNLQ